MSSLNFVKTYSMDYYVFNVHKVLCMLEKCILHSLKLLDQEYLFSYSNLSSYFSLFNILSSKRGALNHTL